MAGCTIIDGKSISQLIKERLRTEVESMKSKHGYTPHLAIIQVGERQDSSSYVNMKKKSAEEAGIHLSVKTLPDSTTQNQLLSHVYEYNNNPNVHGILVQLPLPEAIDPELITDSIIPTKDVDGFHSMNIGKLFKKGTEPLFEACTPKGVIELLKQHDVIIEGKNAVVVGRSNIVGLPMFGMLLKENATVTLCHSRTKDLKEHISKADIVVAAIGSPELIKGEWIKPGAVVIDVGMNAVDDATKKSGYRWVGDVEFALAKTRASLITPVPGGVGPMTVAMLLDNTVKSAKMHLEILHNK